MGGPFIRNGAARCGHDYQLYGAGIDEFLASTRKLPAGFGQTGQLGQESRSAASFDKFVDHS